MAARRIGEGDPPQHGLERLSWRSFKAARHSVSPSPNSSRLGVSAQPAHSTAADETAHLARLELLRQVLGQMLRLPLGNAHLIEVLPLLVLHEEGRRRPLREGHLQITKLRRMLVDELLQRRVVAQTSFTHVERGV